MIAQTRGMGMGRRSLDINRLLLIAVLALLGLVLYRIEQFGGRIAQPNEVATVAPAEEKLVEQLSEKPVQVLGQDVIAAPPAPTAPARKGAKFAIISMNTFETSYDYIAISNKYKYAMKHGYDMIWDFDPNPKMSKVWDRLTQLEKGISAKLRGENDYEWLWWMDFDILITNTSITLESVVEDALKGAEKPDEIELILTPDCFPLNAGSMLFKVTPYTLDLIKQWWKERDVKDKEGHDRSEQDCMRDMIADNKMNVRDKSIFIKQWKLNAFPEEIGCYDEDKRPWEPGMFVVHFAGAWAHVKAEDPTGMLMRKYYDLVDKEA